MAHDIIPATKREWLDACGMPESDFPALFSRIIAGERPFEEWMHAHGRSDEEIAELYSAIDQWLLRKGIIHRSSPFPGLN